MKVDLFLSNCNSESAKMNFEYIKQHLDETHFVIVPDRFSVTVEKQILKSLGVKCCFNVTVIPLSRFCNRYLSSGNEKLLTKLQSIMIIKKCIMDNIDKLTCFKKSCKTENFSESIFDTIMQLKSCLITPNDITEDNLSPSLKGKLADIKIIYNAYEEYLKEKYVDSFNRLNLFCEKLYLQTELKHANIHFVYYENFTPLILKVVNALMRHCKSVNFALCVAPKEQNNSYIYSLDMLSQIVLETKSLDIIPTYHQNKPEQSTQNYLRENLFSYLTKQPIILKENFPVLCSFSTVQNEVEYICANITKQVQQNKLRYKDITVACANLEDYCLILENTFKKFNIPYYVDLSKNLSETCIFKTIKNILLYLCFANKDNVFNLLDDAILDFESEKVNNYKTFVKKYNIKFNFLNSFNVGKDEEVFCDVSSMQQQLKKELSYFANFSELTKIEDYCLMLKNFLNSDEFAKKMQNFYKKLQKIDNFQLKVEMQALDKLKNLLDSIDEILCEIEISLKEFVDFLTTGAVATVISVLPLSVDCVFIGDVNKSVFESVNTLFVCGANEQSFPIVQQDVGLFSDLELEKLSIKKVVEPTIRQINFRNRLKCVQLVSNFTSQLFLTYSMLDIGANACSASVVFKQISNLFLTYNSCVDNYMNLLVKNEQKIKEENSDIQNLLYYMPNKQIAEDKLLYAIKNYVNVINQQNYDAYENIFNYLITYDNRFNALIDNLKHKHATCANSIDTLFKDNYTSISQIEKYYSCPFKHFAYYSLMLKEVESGDNLSAQIGTILHSVCEQFVKYLIDNNFAVLEDKIDIFALNYVNNAIKENNFGYIEDNCDNKLLMKDLKNESIRVCHFLYNSINNSKFKPKSAEESFGFKNSTLKEIELKTKNQTYKVRGKIDRVDTYGDYYRIIDYKTGSTSFDYEQLYYGEKLQLFVYQKAISDQTGMKSAGVFYLPLSNSLLNAKQNEFDKYKLDGIVLNNTEVALFQDSTLNEDNLVSSYMPFSLKYDKDKNTIVVKDNKNVVTQEVLNWLSDYAHNLCISAIEEILSNNISPKPLKNGYFSSCDFCPYLSLCRFNGETDGYRSKNITISVKSEDNKNAE